MKKPNNFLHYLSRIGSSSSQMFNAVFLLGHPNESISGRSYRENWKLQHVINKIFFWQENHCLQSYLSDLRWARDYIKQHGK